MKGKGRRAARICLTCAFLSLFCLSAYQLGSGWYASRQEQQKFHELKEAVDTAGSTAAAGILPEYQELAARNEDFFGWLQIADTSLDYPVMYSPDEPQRYLHRDFDRGEAQGGTPFLDGACCEGGGIYLIYGHHMKNGTMFGVLPEYSSQEYWQKHQTVRFDTLYERGEYEVMAAFYARIYAEGEAGFRYYQYTDLSDPARFDGFLQQVAANALYETGVSAQYGQPLLVLSTCSYHTAEGRFVVVAVKRQSDEQKE